MQYEHPQLVPLGSGLQLILAPNGEKNLIAGDSNNTHYACYFEETDD
jgi:hypothetical protein